jgi:hypothetical protein
MAIDALLSAAHNGLWSGQQYGSDKLRALCYRCDKIKYYEVAVHAARMGEMWSAYIPLGEKPEGKKPRGTCRCLWEDKLIFQLYCALEEAELKWLMLQSSSLSLWSQEWPSITLKVESDRRGQVE